MKPAGRRQKGNLGERELVRLLQGARIRHFSSFLSARRVPLSGAMSRTGFGGDVLVDLGDGERKIEVKRRAQGFKKIDDWLDPETFAVCYRRDHGEWIITLRLKDWAEPKTE